MNYTRKSLSGAASVFIFLVLTAGLSYLLRLVLAKKLTVAEYGLFYSAYALVQLLVIARDLGLRNALAKFLPEFLARRRMRLAKGGIVLVFWVQLATSAALTIILLVMSKALAEKYFHAAGAAPVMALFAVVFLISFVEEIFIYSLQGFQRMLMFSIAPAIRMALIVVFSIAYLALGLGVLAPVAAYLTTYIINAALYATLFFSTAFKSFFRIRAEISGQLAAGMLRFGLLTMLAYTGGFVLSYTDTMVITYFKGLSEVGLYQAAMPTTTMLWYVGMALSTIILPVSSELWAKKKKPILKAGIELSHRYSIVAVMPLALTMAAFPDVIIRILFGEQYIAASAAMQILAIGAVIYTISTLNTSVLSGIGKPHINTIVIFIAAGINLVLNLVLVPAYGIIGAAAATLAGYAAMALLSTLMLRRKVSIDEPWIPWLKTAVAGALFVAVVSVLKALLNIGVLPELAACLVSAGLAYTAALFLLKVVNVDEIRRIRRRFSQ